MQSSLLCLHTSHAKYGQCIHPTSIQQGLYTLQGRLYTPDCIKKLLIAINGQFSAPTIYAVEGDRVAVTLRNYISTEGIVIPWHGILQVRIPHLADQPPKVTGASNQISCTFYTSSGHLWSWNLTVRAFACMQRNLDALLWPWWRCVCIPVPDQVCIGFRSMAMILAACVGLLLTVINCWSEGSLLPETTPTSAWTQRKAAQSTSSR
jgi:hypothetical protein